jgi:transposase
VKSRSRLVMSVRSLLDSEGMDVKSCTTEAFVDVVSNIAEELPEEIWNAIEPTLTSIHMVSEQITDCDKRIKEVMNKDADVKRLKTVPGVGTIVAACFLTTIRDTARFESGRQVGAYLGLVPSLYQSGKTCRRGRITKHGNKQARWLLCIAANALLRTKSKSSLKEWGGELVDRIGRKKAIVAIARKLASVMWAILKSRQISNLV